MLDETSLHKRPCQPVKTFPQLRIALELWRQWQFRFGLSGPVEAIENDTPSIKLEVFMKYKMIKLVSDLWPVDN